MTAYCSLDAALSLLGDVVLRDAAAGVTATTPTRAQAQALLEQTAQEIDMHLRGHGYALPITDDDANEALHAIAMNGTAARIGKAKWPADTGPGGERGIVAALREDYRRGLEFIDSGGLALDALSEERPTGIGWSFTRPYAVLADALDTHDDEPTF